MTQEKISLNKETSSSGEIRNMSEKDGTFINLSKNDLIYDVLKKYNLILLVGEKGTNSLLLQKFKENRPSAILINIGYELSQKLLHAQLEITQNPQSFFAELLKDTNKEFVLFDNTDILFDHNLNFDPLLIFKQISSQKKLIAVWNGRYEQDQLTFAKPGHSEYRNYVIDNNGIYIIKSVEVPL